MIYQNHQFKISANESTLHSVIDLKTGHNVDFRKENTLRDILGFDSKINYAGYNYSDRKSKYNRYW